MIFIVLLLILLIVVVNSVVDESKEYINRLKVEQGHNTNQYNK